MKNTATKKRVFQITVEDGPGKSATGYLGPLRFVVADIALGYTMLRHPKFITAGEILINSLWVDGSPRLQKDGDLFVDACLKARSILGGFEVEVVGDDYTVTRLEKRKNETEARPVKYTCNLGGKVSREALETALGYMSPTSGNPLVLSAGKAVMLSAWVSGDEAMKTEDDLLIPLCLMASEKIKFRQGEVKKVSDNS